MYRLIARLLCPVLEQPTLQPRLRAALLTARDAEGDSLLVCATRAGLDAIVRSLLALSARQSLLRALKTQRLPDTEDEPTTPPSRRKLDSREMLFSSGTGKWALQVAIESGPSLQHYECVQLLLAYRGPHAPLPFDSKWAPRGSLPDTDEPWAESVKQLHNLVRGGDDDGITIPKNASIIWGTSDRCYVVSGRWDLTECGASMVRLATVSSRRGDDELNGRQVVLKFFRDHDQVLARGAT